MMVLSSAISATCGKQQKRGSWSGIQVSDPDATISLDFGKRFIEIKGARMIVYEGYKFDNIKVTYETIDYMRIILTYPPDPSKPFNIYSYPHHGKITWYGQDGKVVGTGIFVSNGSEVPPYGGYLLVTGSNLFVKGKYWVQNFVEISINGWIVLYPGILDHEGWYIITNDGD